jgi:integrase
MTFGELFSAYRASLKPSSDSFIRYLYIYKQYFKKWDGREINTITKTEILLFRQTYQHTPEQCRKGLILVRAMYNWARNTIDPHAMRCMYEGQNPAADVKPPKRIARERVMDRAEIKLILANLDLLSIKHQALLVARLMTPCRIKELCEMKRDDVTPSGKWTKYKTKTGRPQVVHVPHIVMEYLRALPHEGEYFFMGKYGHPLKPESARKTWRRFSDALGMRDVWLLDFRRTLASYCFMEIEGCSELTIKGLLNHYDSRPLAVYTRLSYDYLAEIIEKFSLWIWKLKPMEDGLAPPLPVIGDVPGCPPTRPLVTTTHPEEEHVS